jgi:hypothetical protein
MSPVILPKSTELPVAKRTRNTHRQMTDVDTTEAN